MSPTPLLAALSGGLLALAFPGTGDQGWLAFVALVPLLVAVDGRGWRRAATSGFAAGLVFWLATIPWVAPTMVRYGGLPWPLAGLVLLALAGYLSVYWAAFGALLALGPRRSGAAVSVIATASLWVALEFLRAHLLTGFPWNLLGYSQHATLPLIQVAAVTGVYGVSFVVVAVNAALARALRFREGWSPAAGAVGVGALVSLAALGSGRLLPAPQTPSIPVALVQGNIDQAAKWDPARQEETLRLYRALTRAASRDRPRLVVWPETAVPFFVREDARLAEIQALAREAGAYLLVGAPDRSGDRATNSAFLLGTDGAVLDRYDKRHLVPFGEYVPLKPLLFFVNVLAGGAIGEFAPGGEATVFTTPAGRFGVVICYEAIFPDEVREFFLGGADFLVNITNDAWFGRSAAPAQHLSMAVFRAVENRAYLVRAANTGISAVVAPDGRIAQASGLFTPAVLSGAIAPRAGVTVYTRYGDVFAWGAVAVAIGWAGLASVAWVRRRTADERAPSQPLEPGNAGPVLIGAGAVAVALFGWRALAAGGRGYQEVLGWRHPSGEGRFITVDPQPTLAELRALGQALRRDYGRRDRIAVMVFDDPEAAWQVRMGSKVMGEARFQAALVHQRAMYERDRARSVHRMTIYDVYPTPREVIRYR